MFKKLLLKIKNLFIGDQGYGLREIDVSLEDDAIGHTDEPKGLPVIKPIVLVDAFSKKINELKFTMAMKDEDFDSFVYPAIVNYILFVDLLPASQYKHHASSAGLIVHALECALFAARKVKHSVFPNTNVLRVDVQQSSRQWQVATVLSALMHDGGKVLTDLIVHNGEDVNSEGYRRWEFEDYPTINQWAEAQGIERYFVSWSKNRHRKHIVPGVTVISRVIPPHVWSWLKKSRDGANIFYCMTASIAGHEKDHVMTNIIIESDIESIRHNMIHRRKHMTKEHTRIRLSDLIKNLIKHFILKGTFSVNKRGAEIWYVENKLYFMWQTIVPIIVAELDALDFSIPDSPDVLAEMMIDDGVCERVDDERLYDVIAPEVLGDSKRPVLLSCLRVYDISIFFVNPQKIYSVKNHPKIKESENESIEIAKPRSSGESSIATLRRLIPTFSSYKITSSEHSENGQISKIEDELKNEVAKYLVEHMDCEYKEGKVHVDYEKLNMYAYHLASRFNFDVLNVDKFFSDISEIEIGQISDE